jgi:NADPH:quinone reductase-like Zn-dependent oxidoreductase
MGGRRAELDLGRMLVKRQRLVGSTLRTRSVPRKEEVLKALHQHVWPALERGDAEVVVSDRFQLAEAEAAHERVASNETVGKVLLVVER